MNSKMRPCCCLKTTSGKTKKAQTQAQIQEYHAYEEGRDLPPTVIAVAENDTACTARVTAREVLRPGHDKA